MRSYNTSRVFFGLLELIAWPALGIGVLLIIYSIRNLLGLGIYGFDVNQSLQLLILGPAMLLILYSLLVILIAQVGRAGVDTAELTGQMLKVARDQLEVSKQSLRASEVVSRSYEGLALKGDDDTPMADYGAAFASGRAEAAAGTSAANGTASTVSADGLVQLPIVDATTAYRGREILHSGAAYLVEGERFATLSGAKAAIDDLLKVKR